MKTCRQYWRNLQGRCLLNFNWEEIDHDSTVLISASEYRRGDADLSHSPRFVGDGTIRVRNISPHGPPFDPNHGVAFVVTVDWDTPLDIVTDITLLEVKPQSFGTTRLPYSAAPMDLGASTLHNGRLYIFFGDSGPSFDKPIGVIPQVTGDSSDFADLGRYFVPPEYRIRLSGVDLNTKNCQWGATDPNAVRHIGQDQTPTGAFSYDNRCYVFAVFRTCLFPDDPVKDYVSVLTRSPDPYASGGVFDFVGALDGSVLGQVAPWVIPHHELAGLPQSDATDGLIMLCQSGGPAPVPGESGIFLAWMPLRRGLSPSPSEIWFYTGRGQTPWSRSSQDAKELIHLTFFWSSVSVGRIPSTGDWLLLYQRSLGQDLNPKDGSPHDAFNSHGIFARIASTPWGLAQAEELEIFNPDRDGAWINGLMTDRARSFAYGAFLLNPYTHWDATTREVTIFYLMSTFEPYRAVVMRSRIRVA